MEHGARGGDELNHPEAGKNYGWPVITYGVDYSGAKIGEGTAKPGMEQPVYYWDPVIAPPGWSSTRGTRALEGHPHRLAEAGAPGPADDGGRGASRGKSGTSRTWTRRIRDVRQGPDGFVYLLTDRRDGRILRVHASAADAAELTSPWT